MAKYQKFARFQPYMVKFCPFGTTALKMLQIKPENMTGVRGAGLDRPATASLWRLHGIKVSLRYHFGFLCVHFQKKHFKILFSSDEHKRSLIHISFSWIQFIHWCPLVSSLTNSFIDHLFCDMNNKAFNVTLLGQGLITQRFQENK